MEEFLILFPVKSRIKSNLLLSNISLRKSNGKVNSELCKKMNSHKIIIFYYKYKKIIFSLHQLKKKLQECKRQEWMKSMMKMSGNSHEKGSVTEREQKKGREAKQSKHARKVVLG